MCILKGRGDERTLLFFMVGYGDCKKILSGIRFEQVVVSMRPIPHKDVVRAVQVTSRFPSVHGAPIHIGDPKLIGIHDFISLILGIRSPSVRRKPRYFGPVGSPPQAVAMEVKPDIMITHAPGHMFITDLRDEQLGVL